MFTLILPCQQNRKIKAQEEEFDFRHSFNIEEHSANKHLTKTLKAHYLCCASSSRIRLRGKELDEEIGMGTGGIGQGKDRGKQSWKRQLQSGSSSGISWKPSAIETPKDPRERPQLRRLEMGDMEDEPAISCNQEGYTAEALVRQPS